MKNDKLAYDLMVFSLAKGFFKARGYCTLPVEISITPASF